MFTNSQYLNGQFIEFSEAQIEQLISSLHGMKPVENDILNQEKSVNKEIKLVSNKKEMVDIKN